MAALNSRASVPLAPAESESFRTQGGLRQSSRDLPGCPQGRQKNPRSSQAHDRN